MALIFGKKSLFWKTGIDNSKLDKDTKKTKNLLGGLTKSTGLLAAGFAAAAAAGLILANQFKKIVSAGMPFGETMSHLLAVTRAIPADFAKLRQSAMELGATTAFTATQVGQMQVELAKLGFTADEILNATAPALDAAAASGEELAVVAAVAAGNVRVFNIEAANTSRVTDVMAESFATSALDLEKFKESTKSAGPLVQAWGGNVEMMTTLLAKLADKQISGSIAGMGLKNMFSQLKDESSSVAQVLGGTANNWEELIDLLKKAKERGQEFNDDALVNLDKRVQAIIINLAKSSDELQDYYENLLQADGAAKQMAETRLDNLSGDVKILNSASEGLYLTLYDKMLPTLRSIVQIATKMVTVINRAFQKPESLDDLNKSIVDSKTQFLTLIKIYTTLNDKTSRNEAENEMLNSTIKQLNENYGQYLGNIDLETASRDELNRVIKQTTDALIEEATTKFVLEERKDLINDIAEANKNIIELESKRISTEIEIQERTKLQQEAYRELESEILGLQSRKDDLNDAERIGLKMKIEELGNMKKSELQNETLVALNQELRSINKDIIDQEKERTELQEQLTEHGKTYKDILESIAKGDYLKTLAESMQKVNKVMVDDLIDQIKDSMEGLKDDPDLEIIPEIPEDQLTQLEEYTESFIEKYSNEIQSFAGLITDSLSSAFADFIIEGEQDWDQFLKYLEKQLLASALQALFFQLLGVGSGGGSLFAGLFGAAGGAATQGFTGGLPNNYLNGATGYSIPNPQSPIVNVNSNPVINNDFTRLENKINELSRAIINRPVVLNVNNKMAGSLVNSGVKYNNATKDN